MLEVEYLEQGGHKGYMTWFGDVADLRVKLTQENKTLLRTKKPSIINFNRSIRPDEVSAAFNGIGDLLSCGEHLSRSISTVAATFKRERRITHVLCNLENAVRSGVPLSSAMRSYKDVFGEAAISMVTSGEASGRLALTLKAMSNHIREMRDIREETMRRLAYPAFVLVIGILALGINTTFIIPKIMKSELFQMAGKSDKANADVFASLMMWVSRGVPAVVLGIFLIGTLLFVLYKRDQEAFERIVFRVPYIRGFIFDQAYHVAFSSMAGLLGVGVKLDLAFEIVQKSVGFHTVRREFEGARKALREGRPFVEGMKSLELTERTMMQTSMNMARLQENFESVSQRFYRSFLSRVRGLGPKIYFGVMMLVMSMFFMMFMGVMMPYFRIMNSLR